MLALLSRRLTNDEVKAVASELMQRGDFDQIDIGVAITQFTDRLPAPEDIERVRPGWPPRAGRSTTSATVRAADSRSACSIRCAGLRGAVTAARPRGRDQSR
ncbi:hypothetical protein I553_2592 [Mycobacterium xenopi 4042]|uniref:Uncharacterized protein n=1 Tax=Mycobacterium xenopi 4042 TaxID=1299334 RepID=X8CAQ9_MYCXE|nr:hypothetical protein I553_2592 [Mycobacterium xenopi 4042]